MLTELPHEMDEQVKMFLKAVKHVRPESVPDKARRDEIYLTAAQAALDARLAEYETSADQDRVLLDQAVAAGDSRLRDAVEVRLGEKVLLLEARQLVEQKLRSLADQNGDARDAKRQKR